MVFLARILRFLFWLLIVSWSVSILRRIVGRMGQGADPAKPAVGVPNEAVSQKLVRDPICGMHVAEGLSLPLREGAEILHFCSVECRDKYLEGAKKFAANG
jgi:YHS domain-containing protein